MAMDRPSKNNDGLSSVMALPVEQMRQAQRVVAGYALDATDCPDAAKDETRELLLALGLCARI